MKNFSRIVLLATISLCVKSFAQQNLLMEIPMDYRGCFDIVSIDGKSVNTNPTYSSIIKQEWDILCHKDVSTHPRTLEVRTTEKDALGEQISFSIYTDNAIVSENSVTAPFSDILRDPYWMGSRPDKYFQVFQDVELVKLANGNIKMVGNSEISESEEPFWSRKTTISYEFKKTACRF